MAWALPLLSILTALGVVIALVVAVAALREREEPMAIPTAVLMIAVALWGTPVALSYAASSPDWIFRFQQLRYPGTLLSGLAMFVFSMRYAGIDRWLTRGRLGALATIPAITLVLVAFEPLHGLFWSSVSFSEFGAASIMRPEFGPWFYVHLGWMYLIVLAAVFVLANEAFRSDALHRKQAGLVLLAVLLPFILNIGHIAGIGPPTEVDLSPVALSVSGVIFALAFFAFDLAELRPVARKQMIEQLRDGVIVVGPSGRIRDFNPAGAAIVKDLRDEDDPPESLPEALASPTSEITAEVDGETKQYQGEVEVFEDQGGAEVGQLIYLRDVTGIARREQRISVLHRVLRHNIRNELTVLGGHLEFLREQLPDDEQDHLDAMAESTDRIRSIAGKARLVEQTLEQRERMELIDLSGVVTSAIGEISQRYPEAEVTFERPQARDAGPYGSVIDEGLVERAISELIENGLIHGNGAGSSVDVEIRNHARGVHIAVIDDGPGIPREEIEAIESSVETALKHGSGIGLWLARWTADLCGGELAFENRDGRNVVSLWLPGNG